MPYDTLITRADPACCVFLIDQSGSMNDPLPSEEGNQKKADGVADAINRLLQNMVIKCARDEGIRDYLHIAAIGYGTQVGPAFSGALAGKELVPISELGSSPARVDTRTKKVSDGAGGLVEQQVRFPVWFEPRANGGTPMCEALEQAKGIVENWIAKHPNSFPPTVINITDGESTDGDPTAVASAIQALDCADGNVLMYNIHVSSQRAAAIQYPNSEAALPDPFALQLFAMSSTLPNKMLETLKAEGVHATEGSRGFVFNAGLEDIIRLLNIGSPVAKMR